VVQVKVLERGIKYGTSSDADKAKQALPYCCVTGVLQCVTGLLCIVAQVKVLERGIKYSTSSDADKAKQALAFRCVTGLSRSRGAVVPCNVCRGAGEGA
jgi:hypothetical protein